MAHGKAVWGWTFRVSGIGVPIPPVFNYQLDGEQNAADWIPWLASVDGAPGYVSPNMTFCGIPDLVGATPGHTPTPPVDLWYSHSGNPGTWLLVDPADWTISFVCAPVLPSPRWPYTVTLSILDFLNIDPYLPSGLGVKDMYLMLTEHSHAENVKLGLPIRLSGGVGPV